MARIVRWKEKLILYFMSLFLVVAQAWPFGVNNTRDNAHSAHSSLVALSKSTLAVEVTRERPYVRVLRASMVPVMLPLTAGAYIAMAGKPGISGEPEAYVGLETTGGSCHTGTGGTTGGGGCYTLFCSQYLTNNQTKGTCYTCGYGTCTGMPPGCIG